MAEPFVGEIRMTGFNFAPEGWALCNGQLLPIQQNTALFSLIGTFYGGDGVQTFALPDLRGRVAVHQGQAPGLSSYNVGEVTGVEAVALGTNQIPNHSHTVAPATGTSQTTNRPAGAFPASGGVYAGTAGGVPMGITNSSSIGGNQAHENRQPLLVVNFVIALLGIFPSRS
ncbi:MAG TPA: tail fiber protein [Gaiellaceae bacterium]|jgi:microcystin-dependent protein|nr:tail fiber protein [Gaiellaceae bacterium]